MVGKVSGEYAASAIVAGLILAGLFMLLADAPASWLVVDRSLPEHVVEARLRDAEGLALLVLPLADLPVRTELLRALLRFILASLTGCLTLRVLDGPARWPAVVTATAVAGATLSEVDAGLGELVLATLASALLVERLRWRARPHGPSKYELMRALILVCACAWLNLATGAFLAGLLALATLRSGASPGRDERTETGAAELREGVPLQLLLVVAVVGLCGSLLAGYGGSWGAVLRADSNLSPSPLLWAGVVALFVMSLRRRDARLILLLVVAHVLLGARSPVPQPLAACLLAMGTAAWVWLAGTLVRAPKAALATAGVTATLVLGGLLLAAQNDASVRQTVAARRATNGPLRLYEKGLVVPRDTLFVTAPWLAQELRRARLEYGWRPDVAIAEADEHHSVERMHMFLETLADGTRAVSDSFDGGGLWSAEATHDSGPLFWYVGESLAAERMLTDLAPTSLSKAAFDPLARRRLSVLEIERARFRRTIDEPLAALDALALEPTRRTSLKMHLQVMSGALAHAGGESELDRLDPTDMSWSPVGAALAEAGDLMFAYGDHQQATILFLEAADGGDPRALPALARWQLRAGQDGAAWRTLTELADTPELRHQALAMIDWLLARERIADAQRLRDMTTEGPSPGPNDAPHEIAARLSVLREQARVASPSAPPVATTAPR